MEFLSNDLIVFKSFQFDNNSYLIIKNKHAVVIDVSFNNQTISDYLKKHQVVLDGIICTHAHFDHVGYASMLGKEFNCLTYLSKRDLVVLQKHSLEKWLPGFEIDKSLQHYQLFETSKLNINNFHFEVWDVPGHTPGSICLAYENYIFTGDTLFVDSIGRSDFPLSSTKMLYQSLTFLASKCQLKNLICPGHGRQATFQEVSKINPLFSKTNN